ncbi:MAG: hypothetical protein HQL08_15680 [Nitrospirae bacterium]|nr:hypothetical protein [Nitrospirota bacterium]
MLMKTAGISAALIALAVAMHTSGVVNLEKPAEELGLLDAKARHIIVGVDITVGRENELPKDLNSIKSMMAKSNAGDRIDIFLIHARSESSQEAIFSVQMPEDSGPMGLALQRAQKAAQCSLSEKWDKSIALYSNEFAQATDLFGFFRFVSQKQAVGKSEGTVLILYTDGQQVGDGFNFERKAPEESDLRKVRTNGLLADLNGIRITFAGVTPTHNITNRHWRKLQSWWHSYLKEAGAKDILISSEREILSKPL